MVEGLDLGQRQIVGHYNGLGDGTGREGSGCGYGTKDRIDRLGSDLTAR